MSHEKAIYQRSLADNLWPANDQVQYLEIIFLCTICDWIRMNFSINELTPDFNFKKQSTLSSWIDL